MSSVCQLGIAKLLAGHIVLLPHVCGRGTCTAWLLSTFCLPKHCSSLSILCGSFAGCVISPFGTRFVDGAALLWQHLVLCSLLLSVHTHVQ
jgi:hypothetical protein